MDAHSNQPSGRIHETGAIDPGAPPAARALLTLSRLDAEIEALQFQELGLVRRLEQLRRNARAAYDEFRAQEIQVMFLESSRHYRTPPESLARMCEWLETAGQRCLQVAALVDSETRSSKEVFDRLHGRVGSLVEQRTALAIPPHLLRLYEISICSACAPGIVAVEGAACSSCGIEIGSPAPQDGVRSCPGCRRVLYWRR